MGWLDDTKKEQMGDVAKRAEFYENAFVGDLTAVWGGSPFEGEIPQMAQCRAYACLLKRSNAYVKLDRKMMFHYMRGEYGYESDNDILNLYYRQLPVGNPFEVVLSQTYTLYRQPPSRVFGDKDSPLNKRAQELYQECGVNSILSRVIVKAGLSPAVAVRPVWRDGNPSFEAILPDLYRVRVNPDNPLEATEIAYQRIVDVDGERKTRIVHWTSDAIYYREPGNWKRVHEQEANPYGELPFAFMRLREGDDFYGEGDWDMVEAAMKSRKTEFAASLDISNSFGVWLVLNTGKSKNADSVKIAPGYVIVTDGVGDPAEGQNPEPVVENVTSSGQYEQIDQTRRDRDAEFMRRKGLPTSIVSAEPGNVASGVSRYIERLGLIERREDLYEPLGEFEERLKRKIMIVAQVDSNGLHRFSDAEIATPVNVDYADESLVMESDKEFTYDKDRLKDGVLSLSEFVRKWGNVDKGISDADAAKFIQENKKLYIEAYGNQSAINGAVPESSDGAAAAGRAASGGAQSDNEIGAGADLKGAATTTGAVAAGNRAN